MTGSGEIDTTSGERTNDNELGVPAEIIVNVGGALSPLRSEIVGSPAL